MSARDTLLRAVELVSDSALASARVHVLGEVLSYDDTKREVSVRPVAQEAGADGVVRRLPDVHGVHLQALRFGAFTMQGPAAQDDVVLLAVSDHCVDRWLADGVIAEADAARPGRQLQNSIAIPIGSPTAPTATGGNLVIGLPSGAQLKITPAGKIGLGTGSVDVLSVLKAAIDALASTTAGGSPLSSAATLTALSVQLATLEGA